MADKQEIEVSPRSLWGHPASWVSMVAGISVLIQAVYGVIAFVFTLTQTTNINSYNYTVTYTAIQGAALLALLLISLIYVQTLALYRARIWSFLSWFIFTYTVIVVWLWHYRHHNHTNVTPTPLTVPFMSYLCANIFIVFASAFFVVLGWGVWTMRPDSVTETKKIDALGRDYATMRTWFLVLGIFMFVAAIMEGIWGWLFVVGYSFGPLWVPLMFYCLFSLLDIIQFAMFVVFNLRRAAAEIKAAGADQSGYDAVRAQGGALVQMFTEHWDELWAVQLFLAMFWVINFGFWVNLWQISGVQWTQYPYFNASDMPLEYWSVFSNSVFNAIFAPLLVYYFVTFWCYNSDIVESTTLKNTFTVAGGLGFGSDNTGYFLRVPIPGTQESEDIYISSKKGIIRVLLVVFFVAFILYQLIAGGFILNEILQSTYLANHFYVWYIFALCFLCVVFVIYVIYAVTSYTGLFEQRAAGGEINATGQTSVNVCNFGRPILTLLFIAFMTMFAYATIASRFQDGSHHIAGTTDPLTRTNSLYYGSLLTILGFLFISVFFVAKDGMMSLYSTNFTYNPSTASAFYRADGANSSVVAGKHHRGLEMSNKER